MITQLSVLFYPSLFELIVLPLDLQKKGTVPTKFLLIKEHKCHIIM